jgi:hypothetical protein
LSGTAELKAWGTSQFIDIPSGSFLMEGDEIQTSSDSLMVLEFPEGSVMRVSGGGDIVVEEMNLDKAPYDIKVLLVHGEVWLNKVLNNASDTNFQISSGNIVVKSNDLNILSLENKMDEIVRVVSGALASVDILNEEKSKVVENISVGVGQEAYFSKDVFQKYWNYESPSIIVALSDDFRDSDFYDFNMAADRGNVDVLTLETSYSSETTETSSVNSDELASVVLSIESDSSVSDSSSQNGSSNLNENNNSSSVGLLSAPKLSAVSGSASPNEDGFYVVTTYLATLTGTVSGASEVYVNDYKLQKFNAGDSNWTYFANAKYNLMKEGENVYNVYSKDSNGNKSEVLTVKVLYKPAPVVNKPAPVATTESSTPSTSSNDSVTSAPTVEDSSQMPDWL